MLSLSLKKAFLLKKRGVISLVGAGGKTTLMFQLAKALAGRGETVLTTTTTKILKPLAHQSAHVILADTPESVIERAVCAVRRHSHVTVGKRHLSDGAKIRGFTPETIRRLWDTRSYDWIIVEADGASRLPLKAPAAHEPVIPPITRYVVGLIGLDAIGKPLTDKWIFRAAHYAELTALPMGRRVTPASIVRAVVHEKGVMKGSPPGAVKILFLNKADLEGALGVGRQIAAMLQKEASAILDGVIIGVAEDQDMLRHVVRIKA